MESNFKSGFVSLIGLPNVGKSTLMNTLIGEKISIISNKPQTTRNKIRGILTREGFQAVFIDTPGIQKPKNKLGEIMLKSAETTMGDVDIILFLIEPTEKVIAKNSGIIEKLKNSKADVFLVINKVDTVEKSILLNLIDEYRKLMDFKEIVPISALTAQNTDMLIERIENYLPKGPKYFPEDCITDQPERQICAEIIREKILQLMHEEIPHGVAVEIMSMKKREGKDIIDMDATIYCEKDSHKGMIIGKQGVKLKEIGTRARADIEAILGSSIYLQLWVKVKTDWRDSDFLIKNFGFEK